jgi:hypothetical protein
MGVRLRRQRRWSDDQLADAVKASTSWSGVQRALGLVAGSNQSVVKGHAVRLGLDTTHFRAVRGGIERPQDEPTLLPDSANLRKAGALLAATWFTLCGYVVAWPLEPCRFDLIVSADGRSDRVQVKATTRKRWNAWTVCIATSGDKSAYDPDDLDYFFVIDGDLSLYLIPISIVAGRVTLGLSNYLNFKVESVGGLLTAAA